MNILGFIAVIIICITVLNVAYLYYRIHKPQIILPPKPTPEQLKEVEQQPIQPVYVDENKPEELPITEASMDRVIKSVNELMGIQTIEKEKPHGAREE